MSVTIFEEFTEFVGSKVLADTVTEIQEEKYLPISVCSIPRVTHVDRLMFTLRYVK
jgi:hypothetical protein